MEQILEFIKQLWQAFVDSGLAKDTADTIGRIITYTAENGVKLMWDIINTLFPNGFTI